MPINAVELSAEDGAADDERFCSSYLIRSIEIRSVPSRKMHLRAPSSPCLHTRDSNAPFSFPE